MLLSQEPRRVPPCPRDDRELWKRGLCLLVRQDADHDAVRIADEEATDAPRLVDRTVDHLMPGPDRLGVCRIDTA